MRIRKEKRTLAGLSEPALSASSTAALGAGSMCSFLPAASSSSAASPPEASCTSSTR